MCAQENHHFGDRAWMIKLSANTLTNHVQMPMKMGQKKPRARARARLCARACACAQEKVVNMVISGGMVMEMWTSDDEWAEFIGV